MSETSNLGGCAKTERGLHRYKAWEVVLPRQKRTIKVEDLAPLHAPETAGTRPRLERLSDTELIESVNNPSNGDPIRINTRTGRVVDGNGRAYELKRRANDPNTSITPDTEVLYEPYTPDTSFFPDIS